MFSQKLQARIDAGMECGSSVRDGWIPLVEELNDQISELDPTYVVDQIKEKFGGLRYYITFSNTVSEENAKKINILIAEAEDKTDSLCDICGGVGKRKMVNEWLIATRCDNHSSDIEEG